MKYDPDNILAASQRTRCPYAEIKGTRINCVDFQPLQTVRAAWLDTYYDDNEQPTGWDEDPEDDVDDIDALPEWPDFDSDSD